MAKMQVSQHQAQQSRYYGVKGWLLVFYILMILSALSALSNAFNEANAMMLGMEMGTWQMISFGQVALMLPFLVLTPMKHRLMPTLAIVCMWLSVVLTVGVFAMSTADYGKNLQATMRAAGTDTLPPEFYAAMGSSMIIFMVALPVVFTLLFTWYLLASKRVNATFRHRLPQSEASSATFGQAHSDPAPSEPAAPSFTPSTEV
ncbi:MAG: hypothetical protein HKM95_00115 [Inquilinus sp.]|nr:hypothetical protein [Inquilinus sp.]